MLQHMAANEEIQAGVVKGQIHQVSPVINTGHGVVRRLIVAKALSPEPPGQPRLRCKVHHRRIPAQLFARQGQHQPVGIETLPIRRTATGTKIGPLSGHFALTEIAEAITFRVLTVKVRQRRKTGVRGLAQRAETGAEVWQWIDGRRRSPGATQHAFEHVGQVRGQQGRGLHLQLRSLPESGQGPLVLPFPVIGDRQIVGQRGLLPDAALQYFQKLRRLGKMPLFKLFVGQGLQTGNTQFRHCMSLLLAPVWPSGQCRPACTIRRVSSSPFHISTSRIDSPGTNGRCP